LGALLLYFALIFVGALLGKALRALPSPDGRYK
jgi:hypothetical protein